MAANTGIEHTDADSVMSAYEFFEKPNFAVFQGKDLRAYYDGANIDEGRQKLQQWLEMIANSNTATIYSLKVYPAERTDITNKTEHSGSTTFRLMQPNTVTRGENGIVLLNQGNGQNNGAAAFNSRLDNLEKTNQELLKQLQDERILSLKQNFEHQIAGLRTQYAEKPDPDVWTRIGELVEKKPEIIDKAMSLVDKLAEGLFYLLKGGKKDFIQTPAVPAVTHQGNNINGTNHATMDQVNDQDNYDNETDQVIAALTDQGAYINPFLTEQQRGLKSSAQYPILKAKVDQLTPEEMDEQQMICIEVLENRITPAVLTHLLLVVACLDNDDLNKLLNNLT